MTPVPPAVDGELAWGYWLRLEKVDGKPVYYDPSGAAWSSIRDCFFRGRLRMATSHPSDAGEILEQLLAVLIAVGRGRRTRDPAFDDMFGQQNGCGRHYMHWLQAERMVVGESFHNDWKLTSEGAAAMRMLFATRPRAIGAIRPGGPSLAELTRLATGPTHGEAARAEIEEKAQTWSHAFVRRGVGAAFGIVALRRDPSDPDVQVARTVWNVVMKVEADRDRLYDFLIERLDRWPAWVAHAYGSQGEALTLLLLAMTLAHARPAAIPGPTPEPD